MEIIERARRYIAGIESVSGSGGSDACYTVALALGRGFALPRDTAWSLFLAWNETNASPPWSEAELRHKLDDAISKGTKPFGFLTDAKAAPRTLQPMMPVPPSRSTASEGMDAAAKRARWPAMRRLTHAEESALASLRSVPVEAVAILGHAGILSAGTYEGHACFFIREGNFCQARRFDGGGLPVPGGVAKAKNLPGATGTFIGPSLLGSDGVTGPPPLVLLVEGCIGLLEAVAAAYLANADHAWTCLAATSAVSRFDRAPELLAQMAGRHVRIIPDAGSAGETGAAHWFTSLRGAGAFVEIFALPEGIKDLGPLVADPDTHHQTLAEIFAL